MLEGKTPNYPGIVMMASAVVTTVFIVKSFRNKQWNYLIANVLILSGLILGMRSILLYQDCDFLLWQVGGPLHEEMNAEELDYEDVENQAVMFDIINMIESNDLWNELVFELISRGDAVRRPDGKIIFSDRAPQYDIIEDIAEYTSPQFEFNADGDIK
jgi:hypothetical protein